MGHNLALEGKLVLNEVLVGLPMHDFFVSWGRVKETPSNQGKKRLNMRSCAANSDPRSADVRASRTELSPRPSK